jgi:DNA-binding CsgD family transcriptional regulator
VALPKRQPVVQAVTMGISQLHLGDVGDSEAVDRQLDAIELALEAGDLGAARRHVRAFRRTILNGEQPRGEVQERLLGGAVLTGQEAATLRLLPDGSLSQKDIARVMGVTRNTLKTHLKSLYLKLGAHCRSEAIHRGREVGLLPRPISFDASPTGDLVDVA